MAPCPPPPESTAQFWLELSPLLSSGPDRSFPSLSMCSFLCDGEFLCADVYLWPTYGSGRDIGWPEIWLRQETG